jgi:hypothetical protein
MPNSDGDADTRRTIATSAQSPAARTDERLKDHDRRLEKLERR